ncbi:hypothetical protein [Loigolactobacillus zhaoyuanensis]|uniref:Uncharacterized protein n=1 Tax=Loigolactobacillus zhaoyuanensis TaxID=2486017 RepID=A0ABW8UGI4_9LACO|nr:hypothetical protein [Loigolactobacillus zhaoyuanensis]
MSKQDKPNSRVARHAAKQPQRATAAKPARNTGAPRQSFITRHRWSLIIIVVLIVAFGVYAEFSSIANDNQAAQPTTTTVASESSSAETNASSKTSTATSSSHHQKSSSTSDEDSNSDTADDSTSSSADSSSVASGDGQNFSSTSEAVAWGQANASSWMAEGYSNFEVVPSGNGYTIQYVK